MSTSIKVDNQVKKEIDRLQARIIIQQGMKLSQQELLKRVLSFVKKREDEFIRDILEWSPISDHDWKEVKYIISDFGNLTGESTIDEEIYGEPHDTR